LPDAFGNAVVDSWAGGISALDRLAFVAGRGLGCLTFHSDAPGEPMEWRPEGPDSEDLPDLVDAARAVVRREQLSHSSPADRQLAAGGSVAGGAQAKMIAGDWVLKLDGVGTTYWPMSRTYYGCRVEYAYSLMARAAGLDYPETRLVDGFHYAIRRFDAGCFMMTLGALRAMDYFAMGTHSYAALFDQLDAFGLDAVTRAEAFRRVVFNVLASNCDDHPKNVSFLADREGNWRLSPAYDLTFTYDPGNEWLAEHHLGVNGKHEGITQADVMTLAGGVSDPGAIIAQVADAVAKWPSFAEQASVPGERADQIADRLAAVRAEFFARA
jgi:serine/threonine-protein kinase HipA